MPFFGILAAISWIFVNNNIIEEKLQHFSLGVEQIDVEFGSCVVGLLEQVDQLLDELSVTEVQNWGRVERFLS